LTSGRTKKEKTDAGQTGEAPQDSGRLDHDGLWKDLVERFFYPLLKRALPELYRDADRDTPPRFLDKEFRDILNTADPKIRTSPHFADYVQEVPLKDGGAEWVINHFEFQRGRGGGNLAERMYHYKSMIYVHYRREPAAIAIVVGKRPKSEPLYYSHLRYGTESVYKYINLILPDLDDEELTSSDNPIDLVLYAAKCALKSKEEFQKYRYLRK
jgi:hypothetical protein